MTSQRKREANRRNAQKAKGPRTRKGKQHSHQNARMHGLSIPLAADRDLQRQLARAIAGDGASDEVLEQASVVAEIELELQRISKARTAMIEMSMRQAPADDREAFNETSRLSSIDAPIVDAFVRAFPTLSRIERYERRALARRKKVLARLEDLQVMASIQVPGAGPASPRMPAHQSGQQMQSLGVDKKYSSNTNFWQNEPKDISRINARPPRRQPYAPSPGRWKPAGASRCR
jgi:hypothetical protein